MASKIGIELVVDDRQVRQASRFLVDQFGRPVGNALDEMGRKGEQALRRIDKETHRAKDSAELLGRTLGVELPRSLQKVLASSELVGPALSAAFNVAVIGGFAAAVVTLVPRFVEFARVASGAGEIARDKLQAVLDRIRDINKELLGGPDAAALAALREEMDALDKRREQLRREAEGELRREPGGFAGTMDPEMLRATQVAGLLRRNEIEALDRQIEERRKAIEELEGQLDRLATADRAAAGILPSKEEFEEVRRRAKEMGIVLQEVARDARQANEAIADSQLQAAAKTFETWQQFMNKHRELAGQIAEDNAEALDKAFTATLKISLDDDQRRLESWVETNKQMLEAHEHMVEQIAGQFEDLFEGNLGQSLARMARKFAARLLAEMVVGLGGGGRAATVPGTNPQGIGVGGLGGLLLGGLGIGGGGGFSLPLPGMGTQPFAATAKAVSAAAGGGTASGAALSVADLTGSTRNVVAGAGGAASLTVARAATGAGGLLSRATGGLPLLGALLGSKLGGTPGMLGGGLLAALAYTALFKGNILANSLGAYLGIGFKAASGLIAGAGGGLIGFGIGSQHGTGAGILGGAGSGALLGAAFGGPIGAAIGGIIGFLGGLFGGLFGGSRRRKQAEAFAREQMLQVQKVVDAFKAFQIDFPGAVGQLDQMRQQAFEQLDKLKGEGRKVFSRSLAPQIDAARKQIEDIQRERERRLGLVFGPPQFALGGAVEGLGIVGWRMSDGRVAAILHEGEHVVKRGPAQRYRAELEAMNRGEPPRGGDTFNVNITALDAQSFSTWLRRGGDGVLLDAFRRARREGRFWGL